MAVLVTRDLVRAFYASTKTIFDDSFQAQAGVHQTIATVVPSSLPVEEYGWLSQLPIMREFTDERVVKKMAEYGFSIRNKKFEATIGVSREALEDEQHGQIKMRVQQMAEAASAHYDQILFALINSGDTALCYDGQPFYSANHPVGGANISNVGTGPLSADALEGALAAMCEIPLDNGEPMMVTPTHLVVHPSQQFTARRLLNSGYYPNTVGAGAGQPAPFAANVLNGMLELVVSPRLATPTEWHVLDCSHAVKPFLIQQRLAPEFRALDGSDGETDNSFLRDEYLYGVRSRDNAGFGLWQYAYKSDGSGA